MSSSTLRRGPPLTEMTEARLAELPTAAHNGDGGAAQLAAGDAAAIPGDVVLVAGDAAFRTLSPADFENASLRKPSSREKDGLEDLETTASCGRRGDTDWSLCSTRFESTGSLERPASASFANDLEAPLSPEHENASPDRHMSWRRIALKITVTITLFLLVSFLLERFAQHGVTKYSRMLMRKMGKGGLFAAVLLFDFVPQPFTYVPLIYMAVRGSMSKHMVFLVCGVASYAGALLGYATGNCLRTGGPLRARGYLNRLTERNPQVVDMMKRRGSLGVLLAALLPVPLAVATWTAGFFDVALPYFMIAALGRWPKIAVFVLLSPSPPVHV